MDLEITLTLIMTFSMLLKSVHCKCTNISCNAGNEDIVLANETTWRKR